MHVAEALPGGRDHGTPALLTLPMCWLPESQSTCKQAQHLCLDAPMSVPPHSVACTAPMGCAWTVCGGCALLHQPPHPPTFTVHCQLTVRATPVLAQHTC